MLKKFSLTLVSITLTFCHSNFATSSTSLEDVMHGNYTIIDMTYPLNSNNAYWPGPLYSPFKYETLATLERNGVFSGIYSTPEHLGTHIDAPNHFENNQLSVDQLPLKTLIGPAAVIDISTKVEVNSDYQLTVKDIILWEKSNSQIEDGSIILLNTGWWKKWNDYEKYKNADENGKLHFPGYSEDAARFLVEKRNIKGIGIDTLSVDYGISSDFGVHHIINGAGKYILENIANIDMLPPTGAMLIIAPIKIEGGSGGQTRIWAILPTS
ncbi:MAG: cyclase family protein [Candidatus Scalinduaceae bacterium]